MLALILFYPRSYDVPNLEERKGTAYWDLPTGSRIGYTLLSGKGIKKANPVIYLHGGPGGPIYNHTISSLTFLADNGYDVYLYDQIGCGQSARLANIEAYTVNRHVTDLNAIVDQISAEKVILIGQSWGGMLANEFVLHHSKKVAQVIFTNPGPMLPIKRELAALAAPDSLVLHRPHFTNKAANEKAHNVRSLFAQKWALLFKNKLADDDEADQFATHLSEELHKSTVKDTTTIRTLEAGAGYYSQLMTVQSFNAVADKRGELDKITIPVLIMKAQYDNQPWGYTQEYVQRYSNSTLVIIPDSGHAISVEQPRVYGQVTNDFLAKKVF